MYRVVHLGVQSTICEWWWCAIWIFYFCNLKISFTSCVSKLHNHSHICLRHRNACCLCVMRMYWYAYYLRPKHPIKSKIPESGISDTLQIFWLLEIQLPYARHYKPWLVFFFTPFFTAANIVEQLILQSCQYFMIFFYSSALYEDAIQIE